MKRRVGLQSALGGHCPALPTDGGSMLARPLCTRPFAQAKTPGLLPDNPLFRRVLAS